MKPRDDLLALTASFLFWTSAWTICWLLVIASWLSCVGNSDSCSLKTFSQTFLNSLLLMQYSTPHLNRIIHSWWKILIDFTIAFVNCYIDIYNCYISNHHWIKVHLKPIPPSAAHASLLLHLELPKTFHVKISILLPC